MLPLSTNCSLLVSLLLHWHIYQETHWLDTLNNYIASKTFHYCFWFPICNIRFFLSRFVAESMQCPPADITTSEDESLVPMDSKWNPITSASTTCITNFSSFSYQKCYQKETKASKTTSSCRNNSNRDTQKAVQLIGMVCRSDRKRGRVFGGIGLQMRSSRLVLLTTITIISCLSINHVSAFDLGEYKTENGASEWVY